MYETSGTRMSGADVQCNLVKVENTEEVLSGVRLYVRRRQVNSRRVNADCVCLTCAVASFRRIRLNTVADRCLISLAHQWGDSRSSNVSIPCLQSVCVCVCVCAWTTLVDIHLKRIAPTQLRSPRGRPHSTTISERHRIVIYRPFRHYSVPFNRHSLAVPLKRTWHAEKSRSGWDANEPTRPDDDCCLVRWPPTAQLSCYKDWI